MEELERMVFIIPSTMIDSSILTIVIISIWNEPREMFIGIVIMVSDLLQSQEKRMRLSIPLKKWNNYFIRFIIKIMWKDRMQEI